MRAVGVVGGCFFQLAADVAVVELVAEFDQGAAFAAGV
jgi:hypothetical protein